MVQTVGMAVIAALIGAGGFGALVFQGLLSSAIDLVLLGGDPGNCSGGAYRRAVRFAYRTAEGET